MKMAPLDIVDGSYKDEDLSFSAQDTVNYLPTVAEQNGTRTPTMLKTPPGLKPSVAVGVTPDEETGFQLAGPIRNSYNAEGRFFVVAGTTLYQITTAGISVPIGTIPGVGRVSFSHNQITNGNEILVNNGNAGYIYNTVTQVFQRITDTSYPGGLRAVFINNRFVQIEPARRYLFNSDLADGLSYNALDRFTSETSPDLVMGIESIGNQLAVFSSTTTEWFEDTGANPQPFRSTGIVADKGAAGPFCTAKLDNQLFFLADDGVFYRYQGYNPIRISTKPIEQAIRNKNWFNAFTTVWEDSGYAVCYWTFPDGETWGYDASTNKWHRRESYGFNRWRINSLTYWRNRWYGGDFQAGRLYQLDWDYLLESDQEFESIRACGVIADSQNRVIHERLELVMNTGMVETVPVAFVDQPIGPQITGDAPSGIVGVAYSFSYTGTPGDSPITRFQIVSGSLLAGLSFNQATGTISGTPTEVGSMTLTVRVYDQNGLFDELVDQISINLGMMALKNEGDSGTGSSLYGDLATASWDVDTLLQNKDELIGTSDGFVAYSSGGHPAYTNDNGVTWAEATGATQSGVGGLRVGGYAVSNNSVVLPQGLTSGVNVSLDGGLSYTAYGAYTASMVACIESGTQRTWVIYNGQNVRIRAVTDDDFSAPSAETNLTGVNTTTGGAIWADDEWCLIGMRTAISPVPALIRTLDGITDEQLVLPTFATATTCVAIGGGYINETRRVVVFTDSGEAAYLDGSSWELSDALPLGLTNIEAACCDGSHIYAIGGGGTTRAIIRTATGQSWEVVRSETGAGVNTEWNNIAARKA